jgi:hypothetical protein
LCLLRIVGETNSLEIDSLIDNQSKFPDNHPAT